MKRSTAGEGEAREGETGEESKSKERLKTEIYFVRREGDTWIHLSTLAVEKSRESW